MRPVRKITAYAQDVAEGKSDVKLGVYSRDDMGHLADSLRTMEITCASIAGQRKAEEARKMGDEAKAAMEEARAAQAMAKQANARA